jgi:hypothetical protein
VVKFTVTVIPTWMVAARDAIGSLYGIQASESLQSNCEIDGMV